MKKKALILGGVIVIFLIIVPFVVNMWCPVNEKTTADGILSYIVGCFSGIGTISLSILALYQNKIQQSENEKSQKELEKRSIEANEISQRMLAIEEENNRPFVDIQAIRKADTNIKKKAERIDVSFIYNNEYYDTDTQFKDDELNFKAYGFFISNVQDHDIIDFGIKDIGYEAISYRTGSSLKQYDLEEVSYSDCGTIRAHESTVLYLPFPKIIWAEIAQLNINEDRVGLGITLKIILMGNHGTEYEENILFTTEKLVAINMESLRVSNKKIEINKIL